MLRRPTRFAVRLAARLVGLAEVRFRFGPLVVGLKDPLRLADDASRSAAASGMFAGRCKGAQPPLGILLLARGVGSTRLVGSRNRRVSPALVSVRTFAGPKLLLLNSHCDSPHSWL